VLDEHIEDVQLFALDTECQEVAAQGVSALENKGCDIVIQLIGVAAVVGADIDIDIVQLDAHLAKVCPANRNLTVVDFQIGSPDFG
jgi:hypothetical protein